MKIELILRDRVKGHPTERIRIDQKVHKGLHVGTIVQTIRKIKPWVKIINIRVDLR